MKIELRVKTRAKIEKVVLAPSGIYEISLNVPPVEGQANARVIELLAAFFKVSKSSIRILRGLKSKSKLVEVLK